MLSLLRVSPQGFVDLLLPGARYLDEQPQKLQSHQRTVDGLVKVQLKDDIMLIHFEFQSHNDSTMAKRLQEYNMLIWNEFEIPVLSCVIHLLGDGHIAPTPFVRTLSVGAGGMKIHGFCYETIEVGDLGADDILANAPTRALATADSDKRWSYTRSDPTYV